MKIYFAYSKWISTEQYNLVTKYFEKLGHTILLRQVAEDPKTINFEEAEKIYVNNSRMIKAADIVIAECSYVSSGIGHDIAMALQEKKPVIALYNMSINRGDERHVRNVPVDLKGNNNRYFILKEYSPNDFERTINLALKDAMALVDTKFILIIPPEIDRYLEWNVNEKGLPKAEITRTAIEKMMKEDARYQTYLKDNGIDE